MAQEIDIVLEVTDKATGKIRKITKTIDTELGKTKKSTSLLSDSFKKVGSALLSMGKIAGGILLADIFRQALNAVKNFVGFFTTDAISAALEFDKGMRGIKKTVNGFDVKPIKELGKEIRNLKTPTSFAELQEIGRIGGNFNIAAKDLTAFIAEVDKVNVALGDDFAGGVEEVAREMAGLTNVFKKSFNPTETVATRIKRAGSAVNELSKLAGVTAPNLTNFANRVGGMMKQLDVKEAFAFGAALEQMGVSAELGARNLGIVFSTAAKDVKTFAKQMGLSQKATRKLIDEDPVGFIKEFSKSVKGLTASQLAEFLDDVGLTGTGADTVIKNLALNTDILDKSLEIANKAFEENISLQDEFNSVTTDNSAKFDIFNKGLENIQLTLGDVFLEVFNLVGGFELMDFIMQNINEFSEGFMSGFETQMEPIKEAANGFKDALVNMGIEFGILDENTAINTESMGQSLGENFGGAVVWVVKKLTELANWFTENKDDIFLTIDNIGNIAKSTAGAINTMVVIGMTIAKIIKPAVELISKLTILDDMFFYLIDNWDTFKIEAIKAVNIVIGAINGLIRTINSVPGINVPTINQIGVSSAGNTALSGLNRASGGPVQAGQLYEVGENNKAEMFMSGGKQFMIPGNNGRILNEGQLQSNNQTSNVYNFNIYNAQNPKEVVEEVRKMIAREIDSSNLGLSRGY